GEAEEPRHLRARGREVGGNVERVDLRLELAVLADEARREVRIHRTAAGPRIVRDVRVRVELSKELVERRGAGREHERLIAVIARAPVTAAECARPCELRDFFPVAKDAELRLAGQDFFAPDQAGVTA